MTSCALTELTEGKCKNYFKILPTISYPIGYISISKVQFAYEVVFLFKNCFKKININFAFEVFKICY